MTTVKRSDLVQDENQKVKPLGRRVSDKKYPFSQVPGYQELSF